MSTGATGRVPSPDFSSLSPDELERLEGVLQRQVLIEDEQNQRLSGLRRTMVHLQQTIEHEQQRTASSPPLQQVSTIFSSTDIIQCYICYSNIEIKSNTLVLSPPVLCADCHRPVCRRCGNYTSPELVSIQYGNNFENQTHSSKWRCRMCIVRREVVRKSGMYLSVKRMGKNHKN